MLYWWEQGKGKMPENQLPDMKRLLIYNHWAGCTSNKGFHQYLFCVVCILLLG